MRSRGGLAVISWRLRYAAGVAVSLALLVYELLFYAVHGGVACRLPVMFALGVLVYGGVSTLAAIARKGMLYSAGMAAAFHLGNVLVNVLLIVLGEPYAAVFASAYGLVATATMFTMLVDLDRLLDGEHRPC